MPREPGEHLLHYRLVEKIGQGGMGSVWRARDTTLDRDAAIKILPDDLAGDAQFLARFEREAKLLASLSHPNLAAVFGVHSADGARFLAMEFVPGEDLSARLERAPLPIPDALEVMGHIADALQAHHAYGALVIERQEVRHPIGDRDGQEVIDEAFPRARVGGVVIAHLQPPAQISDVGEIVRRRGSDQPGR